MAYGKCFLSGTYGIVERHHIFGGARRDLSERYGLVVYLSPEKHQIDRDSAHRSGETADRLHRYGQRKAMLENDWTVEQFRLVFGKNYLDADELAEIRAMQEKKLPPSATCAAATSLREGGMARTGFQVLAGALPF